MGQHCGERLTFPRAVPALALVVSLAALVGACGTSARPAPRPATRTATPAASSDVATTAPLAGGPLVAPQTTSTQDALYFQDLARVDPSLATYVDREQGVALKALITDGSAFCAFLRRGGGIDNAMESVVIGANGVESQTHLPSSITTWNAIDAVALVVLCPTEQDLLPAVDRTTITQLARSLSSPATGAGGAAA